MQVIDVRGVPVQVSDEDHQWALQWRWVWMGNTRYGMSTRYAARNGLRSGSRRLRIYMHQAIWERMGFTVPSDMVIDHKDRDPHNNQRDNLRVLTPSADGANKDAKGCSWNKRNQKWVAYITKDQVRRHIGYFRTEEAALAAREEAKQRLFPELYEDEDGREDLRIHGPPRLSADRRPVKGYSWSERKKRWKASITKNRVFYHLGWFRHEEDARAAYEEAHRRMYPELYEDDGPQAA